MYDFRICEGFILVPFLNSKNAHSAESYGINDIFYEVIDVFSLSVIRKKVHLILSQCTAFQKSVTLSPRTKALVQI